MSFAYNPFTDNLDYRSEGGSGGIGDVNGPASSVDGNIAAFSGTTGKIIQDSGVAVSTIATKFSAVNIQRFTANGTYTPTAGMKYCIIECIGGGGGGGGVQPTGAGQVGAAGGGGSGAFATAVVTAATIGASKAVSVGTGGTAGAIGGNGGGGTVSGITGICTAAGGSGGSAGIAGAASNGSGGSPGNGGTGLLSIGEGGTQGIGSFAAGFIIPGRGARSRFGPAPVSNVIGVGPSILAGSPGFPNSGAGGSGGCNGENSAGTTGGAGGTGIVYIYEFL